MVMTEPVNTTTHLVRRLREVGFSYQEIGRQLGVHWRTIYRWGRDENHPWTATAVNQQLAGILAANHRT
jgi:DNA invertase Pin-like site-specific DNA recombinase